MKSKRELKQTIPQTRIKGVSGQKYKLLGPFHWNPWRLRLEKKKKLAAGMAERESSSEVQKKKKEG